MTRSDALKEFVTANGWGDAEWHPLTGDASTRRYTRLVYGNDTAILMDAPPAAEGLACPPDASPADRKTIGYNAEARLAGPNLNAFTSLAGWLGEAGLSAPKIYGADAEQGFAMISDLGDNLFAVAMKNGSDELALYKAATDVLLRIADASHERPFLENHHLLTYDETALRAETTLLPQWYLPHQRGEIPPLTDESVCTSWQQAWDKPLSKLSQPDALVLRDYHAENLLWLDNRQGLDRVGIIDFQDALYGHAAYDLASMLQDARRDVAPEIEQEILRYYCDQRANDADFEKEQFLLDYAILGAQRNAKILGIFARLIHRDNKPRYADLFPRVEAHFINNISHPDLRPVKAWMQEHKILDALS